MISELKQVAWQQKDNVVSMNVLLPDGREITFPIDEELINYLVGSSPKLVYLHVRFRGDAEERIFYVDLEGIKPFAIKDSDKELKYSPSKEKKKKQRPANATVKGKYTFVRGESHPERFLSDNGWRQAKQNFEIYDTSEKQVEQKTEQPVVEYNTPKLKTDYQLQTKKKSCINCRTKIGFDQQFCPHCNAEQFKKCTQCQHKIPADAVVCQYCGTPQNSNQPTPDPKTTSIENSQSKDNEPFDDDDEDVLDISL